MDEPVCKGCDDWGYVDLDDPESGGVIGPGPCPNPNCPWQNEPAPKLKELDWS